jgi:hypothetical protein
VEAEWDGAITRGGEQVMTTIELTTEEKMGPSVSINRSVRIWVVAMSLIYTFLGKLFGYLIRFCAYLWWA